MLETKDTSASALWKKCLQKIFFGDLKKKVLKICFRQSTEKRVFQKIFQTLHKLLTIPKILLSSSRGQANFRGFEASRPRARTSNCVLKAKDVLENSISNNGNLDLWTSFSTCAERQNRPSMPPIHPWMVPVVNSSGSYWLALVDAYSKYPCIHPIQSIFTKSTIDLLEQDFSRFGFPPIIHLTGAPYHSSINGAAERLVQTFKQILQKSARFPKKAFWTSCSGTGAHRPIVDSLPASYLMIDKYAQNWMQF